jgi:serine/threonine-protein kinase
MDTVFDVHRDLARIGWVASDFYDGCLLYDFARKTLRLIDLDTYNMGPFTNTMGRMFGSSRFMAPEELTLGAAIDERTTVFTLGRTAAEFLSDGTLNRPAFRGSDPLFAVMERACREAPEDRFASVEELCAAWFATTSGSANAQSDRNRCPAARTALSRMSRGRFPWLIPQNLRYTSIKSQRWHRTANSN